MGGVNLNSIETSKISNINLQKAINTAQTAFWKQRKLMQIRTDVAWVKQNAQNLLAQTKSNNNRKISNTPPKAHMLPTNIHTKIASFIKNSQTKENLISLQKKLADPKSSFSKLSTVEKLTIKKNINTKMASINNMENLSNIIENTNDEKQLRNLQKRLDDPSDILGKLSFEHKGEINRKILDKIVMINSSKAATSTLKNAVHDHSKTASITTTKYQAKTQQIKDNQPLASKNKTSVTGFIKNTTSKQQLTNLQKKLNDPQSSFSKLTLQQKSAIKQQINSRMSTIDNIQKVFNRIENINDVGRLRNLQKMLDNPTSSVGKFSLSDRGHIDRKIIDKIVMLRDNKI